jgi:hypothetical protein
VVRNSSVGVYIAENEQEKSTMLTIWKRMKKPETTREKWAYPSKKTVHTTGYALVV